ncbi:MAG: SH3 domain-containing protein [Alphaproteobacteria bacterium]|nr:SH3 domain-containing protein [Alphaproteobacteria bacterium]
MRFAKTQIKESASAAKSHSLAANSSGATGVTPVPLRFADLIAPYRKHGALLFRVEHMGRGARLSAGRNNGDRTWTLNDREIENVDYLPPKGGEQPSQLSLRVIAMPSGQTVAVLNLPLPATKHDDFSAATELPPKHKYKSEEAASDEAAAPEHDIPEPADAGGDSRSGQAPLLTKAEERAQARLAETLAVWQREAADTLARARAQWQEETARVIAEARTGAGHGAQSDIQTALADAERHWKTAEAARAAAAELQWQKKLDAAVAGARTEAERRWQTKLEGAVAEAHAETATHLHTENGETQRLRSETVAARSTLAKREVELEAAREEIEQLRANSQRSVESALEQAEAKWKAGETARRAEVEAEWQEETGKAVAEALSSATKARDERMQSELERLNEELSAATASLAGREAELTELQSAFARAKGDWQREKESARSGAETAWRAAEAKRLAVAKAEWQAQSDKAVAAARAEAETIRRRYSDSDSVREKLAAREDELTQLRAAFLEERTRLQREATEQLVEAEKNWKLDEISRMTQAKEEWQGQTAKAVAEARTSAKPGREMATDIELRRLRAEYTALQATLSARELELKRSKQAAGAPEEIVLRPHRIRPIANTPPGNQKRGKSRKSGIGISVAVVAAAASLVVYLYPNLDDILQPAPKVEISAADAAPATAPKPAAPAPAAEKHAVLLRGANVRTAPSGDASVMLTLPRGTEVAPLERRGSWTRIQVQPDGNSTEPREGWIFTSFLKEADTP